MNPSNAYKFSIPLTEPEWLDCPCGQRSQQVPCWECSQTARANQDAVLAWQKTLSSIPARFADADCRADVARRRVRSTNMDRDVGNMLRSRSVSILGPSGSGKTTLAVMVLKARGEEGMFVDAAKLVAARRQQQFGKASELLDRAERVPVLLIDELNGQTAGLSAVWETVNARHNEGLITLITTGQSIAQIQNDYGDGMVRRMFEPSCALVVTLG